ncbi:ABC transporter ATP-binding protein [Ramlibacter albus]|uniref:ABC transporter ATP-binding protein n=1 Tax=Ramlibacter albus TaxID=2079448 RepID=A0A923MEI5_9BURK|nr:ABC transporter ATP-binding protein [Ramlibacter albus]MBC5767979.1 ABC transporter ATP-binding protein [Ramlibacter albus]
MSFLVIQGLSKSYGGVHALVDFDLSVERGEFISLLGPSGCGKTTTLQALAGFVSATRGRVVLDGKDITDVPPEKRGLGIVFQSYALFPHMTVADNVAFGLEMKGVPRAERDQRVARMLELVHLGEYAQRYPRELSGGQRQRVAVARALVIEPPVLLLDEPLSNLDAKLREAMQFELRRIQRKLGTTTLMVTHDQAEALSISDRVVVMHGGRIQQVDAPHRLYEQPRSRFISGFVGKTNLLQGRWKDGSVELAGGARIAAPGDYADGQELTLVLRPEKILLTPEGGSGVRGRITERFFLGSQWLYRVECPLGELEVACANDGRAPWPEQAEVALDWAPDAASVLPPESA